MKKFRSLMVEKEASPLRTAHIKKTSIIDSIKVSQIYTSANWYPRLETTRGYCMEPRNPSLRLSIELKEGKKCFLGFKI